LSDLSLTFKSGSIIVIVGESGCGKFTLARLLAGLYTPQTGRVEFSGMNIRDFDPASVRRRIAYIAQDPVLFSGTILENLKAFDSDVSGEQIDRALTDSASKEFVHSLPGGITTEVGERGNFLSGGQRQRIALACSLITDPDVLIADEPTSALDDRTTASVLASLTSLAATKTVIIVTHRPDLVTTAKSVFDLTALKAVKAQAA
jgi:ATP-binding cassette, subfamily B, bacterial HlyB/CyaB